MKSKQDGAPKIFDAKKTEPLTPKEAAKQLLGASQQLKRFQLWHPFLHVAHPRFLLPKVKYPIPTNLFAKGVVVSVLESVCGEGRPPQTVSGYVEPFRRAQNTLAHAANICLSVKLFDTANKNCPIGIHSLSLMADQGKELRLQAQYLHETPTTPADARKKVLSLLEKGIEDGWNLLDGDDYILFPRNIRRAQSTAEITIKVSQLNNLENALTKLFKINGQPKRVSWFVHFVDLRRLENVFYHRILDETGRWYHFPRPEILKATGLRGDAGELLMQINKLGFPGETADVRFHASFEKLADTQAFFELAVRGKEMDRAALAMFQTEKGVLAQLCFGTNRAGKIILKVLYAQRGGFGWEDAYEKLQRGEKLLSTSLE